MSTITDELKNFRLSCRECFEHHAKPNLAAWEAQGLVDRDFWLTMGAHGLLGMGVSPELGGQDKPDYRYALALTEEMIAVGMTAPIVISHNDVIASYINLLGTEEQKRRWLPDLCSGRRIAAIAITEPGGGSDSTGLTTQATLEGDHYVVNGGKAFITNGVNADLFVVAVKTDAGARGQGISLIVIERDMPGFTRGPALKKLGWHASDTADLFFDQCVVPKNNLLGRENLGSYYFMTAMTRERLSISTVAITSAEAMMAETLSYVKQRKAFGQPIGSFQYNRFLLAQLDTQIKVTRSYLNEAIEQFNAGSLKLEDAARLKWWATEVQNKVADECLQLHGGSAYLSDSSIGKLWVNSRVQKIYGGTSEIMLEVISKSMGL
ncbi:acyl-CoA dehydrogenase family protein [Photobacterium galatheae]|uniref:Acyl-CoA dehydrogenase n=1 Tax=Photobacterium galatheae TaxID=1654360 RepID=A0A066RHN7_9GAMM|nr:acyl-CoA dehydrogenase family protein [Photobacterium galatheae]KDM89829.1 acyl-CoA dehydrogenase [Photobacterium galatheae]MCM0151126.1 acyl-CoA dehydrogenase family protein [Photobacterium galatheae]